jgi:two-component system chemotaxis response regulator CheY
MKILLVEDDLTSRMFMKKFLTRYGTCDVAVNGLEAIDMVEDSLAKEIPYQLICLDVMMPKVDGLKALKEIRKMESKSELTASKIIMTTALNDRSTVDEAYTLGCEAYAWKPIDIHKFKTLLQELDII